MSKTEPQSDVSVTVSTLLKLALYTVAMMTVPFALFYSVHQKYLDPIFEATVGVPPQDKRTLVAGISAVVGVNIVVIAFVASAFSEKDVKPAKKED